MPTAYQWSGTGGDAGDARRARPATMRAASTSMARSSTGAKGCEVGAVCSRPDRRVELVEGELVDRLGDLAADAAHRPGLVDDEQAMGLPDARDDRVDVERHDGAQVDHLGLDPFGRQRLRRLERALHHLAGRDDGDVGAGARDARDAERHVDARPPAPRPSRRTAPWAPA